MDSIFRDLDFVSCYLDDILIASKSEEEHLRHLKIVLDRLQEHQLIARVSKCAFFLEEIQFLGFRVSAQGKAVDPEKTAAIRQMAPPSTVHGLQRWLGMANYYSAFIPRYAHLTAPLTDLLRNHPGSGKKHSLARIQWQPQHQAAFDQIVDALATPPILKLFDPARPARVAADSSGVALGGKLEQLWDTVWHPVAFYSLKLSPAEQRYTTRERECLAVKQCLAEWRHYLLGAPFKVQSDHQSLKWLQTQDVSTLSDRLLRWIEFFSLFDFNQEYLPGVENVIPDHLSRPATHVLVVSEAGTQDLDLWSLAVLLHDHQDVYPPSCLIAPVLVDSALPERFCDQLRQAQAADPQLADIKAQLEAVNGPPPVFRLLYSIVDNLVVVAETDGRRRIVVPEGPLRLDICKYFHEENGHPGVHRTIHAVTSYFFWPGMHKDIRAFVVSCAACQAAKAKLPNCVLFIILKSPQ